MPQGNVTPTIQDGALGIVPASTANITVTMGVSSLGTAATLYSFSDKDTVSSTLGTGPGVEALAMKLDVAGGPQYFVPINASVVGVASAVTPTRIATSTSVMTVTGTPLDGYSVTVKVTSAGTGQLVTSGAITIKISLDGGNTYGQNVSIPAGGTYVVSGTGLSLVFTTAASANLDFGDQFVFTCKAPYYSSSDLAAAFTGLFADVRTWGLVHIVGFATASTSSANATAGAAMAVAVATQMASAATNFRYARAVMDAPASIDADLISSYATFADTRVRIVGGTAVLTSPLTGRQTIRPAAWADAARLAAIPISESPGFVGAGGNKGIVSLVRDERVTAGLFDARFGCLTTIIGTAGFYSDLGNVMAAAGSDFSTIMNGRVMDQACTVSRTAFLPYLNSSIPVNATTGKILEQVARSIEFKVEAAVRASVVAPGYASDCSVLINRTDNILSTRILRAAVKVTPLGYASSITYVISFLNPALTLT